MRPRSQLIADRRIMLGTAQTVGLLGAECRRNDAIRPGQPPFRGLVDRPAPWRRDRKNPAFAFDQDIARIGGGCRDECDPAGLPRGRLLAHPLCQGTGFSKTASSEQQPDLPPIAGWPKLVWPRDSGPGIFQRISELCSKGISHR
jgi:hypothetical protein